MRPDAFERRLRALRERRQRSVSFPQQQAAPAAAGLLRISLLQLMLISGALAVLIAQAQRPDDISRPFTWALFVGVGTWYGARAWAHHRGLGPLRNCAFAGSVGGAGVSLLLWGFYLAVDAWWGTSAGRVSASFPVLLWWTAAGGAVGALFGAHRGNRAYNIPGLDDASTPALTDVGDVTIRLSRRSSRMPGGAVLMACCASALFHVSVAPLVYREVRMRYRMGDWPWNSRRPLDHSIIMTMAPADADEQDDSFQVSALTDLHKLQTPGDWQPPQIPVGYHLYTVKLGDDTVAGQFIRPGDLVDVISSVRAQGPNVRGKTIITVVRVFAVNSETSRSFSTVDEQRRQAKLITLLVKWKQVRELVTAEKLGAIHLVLRRPMDNQ